jgi:negative regulator of genetic competence, sporulation and motility
LSDAGGNKNEYNERVHQILADFKKAYNSVRTEAMYSILIEFGVPTNLVKLIKMFLNETYSTYISKKLSALSS